MRENDDVKLKIELGDFKFEMKGNAEKLIELAVSTLQKLKGSMSAY